MAPEIGQKYGPYEIISRLGGGGMGHVYRAWDARLHREVAIKLLHNEYSMPGMRERFLREARAASALNHPNICTIFDIGEQNGEPYLVMELLQGETLRDRIHHKTIQIDELVCIARETAEALGAAHAKGVIHRDIKPANIFLVDKPNRGVQAKVLDFGLAKIEGGVLGRGSRSLDLTAAGATVGTLAYMSPEQARGESLDSRSDLFSLGVVMYEMATRQIPFQGATSALVFVQLLNHPPEPVRSWNEAVPRELEKVILKLMAKERTARYQTAHELEEALDKLTDRNAGGGWLRKAVAIPLVRTSDPVARDKRSPKRRGSDSNVDAARDAVEASRPAVERGSPTPAPIMAQTTPRPHGDQPQVMLRPVARVPRIDSTPGSGPAAAASGRLSGGATERVGTGYAVAQATPIPSAARAAEAAEPVKVRAIVSEPDVDAESSAEFAASLPEALERDEGRRFSMPSAPALMVGGVVAVLVLVLGGLLLRGRFRHVLLTGSDVVVLTEIENKTGDKSLDGVISEGLQIDLAQSPYLLLRSGQSYRAAKHFLFPDTGESSGQPMAQHAAQKVGAKAYLFGTMTGKTAPYTIRIDLLNATSNDVMSSVEEKVATRLEIPAAIDHLATRLREDAGEDGGSIAAASNSLDREATGNVDALHMLALGDDAVDSGRLMEALRIYQQAAGIDPKCVQVQLRLAVLYRRLRAETASAEAAKQAVAAAENAGERVRSMAQYEYEMNASGDYTQAAAILRKLVETSPHDSVALSSLSRTLRLEGRFAEALQIAQQVYTADPFYVDAYTQAQNALIGLDRYEAAEQLEAQIQRLGLGNPGGALTAAYLEGRQDLVDSAVAAITAPSTTFRVDWSFGLYLDNVGQLAAGSVLWQGHAARAQQIKGLDSTAAFLLSQGALDRALMGECTAGETMARESDAHSQGMMALFHSGMAHALCGNTSAAREIAGRLEQDYPQGFMQRGFFGADIRAAIALHDHDPAAALELLKPARQFDLISPTPVLRGRANVALGHTQIGIVDFQTVLSHRGVPFMVGSVVYPVAQIGVARAFADTGDVGNSAQAYRRFVELWRTADGNQAMLVEARAHSK